MIDGWPRPSVRAPASVTRFPGPVSGTCSIGSRSPWPPPLAPPPPRPVARHCSAASLLLRRSLTSHARASSASVPHLPDADQSALQPVAGHEISQGHRQLSSLPACGSASGWVIEWDDEICSRPLCWLSVPPRDHQPCRLAVFQVPARVAYG